MNDLTAAPGIIPPGVTGGIGSIPAPPPNVPAPTVVPPLASVPPLPPEPEIELVEHWLERSESISKLVPALAKAQGKIGSAAKDSTNPHFKSKYASLASVREACREPLSEAGIAVFQFPTSGGGRLVTISTMFAFEDEYVMSHLTLKSVQDSPQAIAAAVTYGRRVGLSSMAGVAPEDDDGNEASDILPKGVRREASPPNPTPANQKAGTGTSTSSTVRTVQDQVPPQPAKLPEPTTVSLSEPSAAGASSAPSMPAGNSAPAPVVARASAPAPVPSGVPPPPGRPPMKAPGSN